MRKRKPYTLLLASLVLVSLAGCRTQAPSAVGDGIYATGTQTDVTLTTTAKDDMPAVTVSTTEPKNVSETPAPESIPTEEKTQEAQPQEDAVVPSLEQQEQSSHVETSKPTEPPKKEEPKPAPTEPVPTVPEPSTEPPPEEEETEPEFHIEDWVSYAQNYATSVGLRLESSAVDCWDTPISAGPHSFSLERDIQSRLDRYSRNEDITDVWIWAQSRSDGSYDLYIGYA